MNLKDSKRPGYSHRCECCGALIKDGRGVQLELDCDTGLYHADGLPEGATSQGWFWFGQTCAANIIKANHGETA